MGIRKKDKFVNEKGFTLVEVLASLVIISVILMGFFSLLTFTNKTAVTNNTKLVTINLAKASIERMKLQPESYFDLVDVSEYTKTNCPTDGCEQLFELIVNDEIYVVEVNVSQNEEEEKLKLINALVTVGHSTKNIKSVVEGYISYAVFEEE